MLKRELKINLKSLIIWTCILVGMFLIVFLIYPSIIKEGNTEALKEMMSVFPEEMLKAFNMDITEISSVFGWFKTEGYMFLTIIGALYSAITGCTILLKEESDKTIEFLYSKPIKRSSIVTSKIFCGIINILIMTIFTYAFNLIGFAISDDLELKEFTLLSMAPLMLYFSTFFISLFISTFFRKTKKTMGIGIGLVFISYFLQMIGNLGDKTKAFKNISLFELAPARNIILKGSIEIKIVLISLCIILITGIGTYIRYNRKEFI